MPKTTSARASARASALAALLQWIPTFILTKLWSLCVVSDPDFSALSFRRHRVPSAILLFAKEQPTMVNRPTAAAAAFAGIIAAAASVTSSLPSVQAFVAPSISTTTRSITTALAMSNGSEECPEMPTSPILSRNNDVAAIALG